MSGLKTLPGSSPLKNTVSGNRHDNLQTSDEVSDSRSSATKGTSPVTKRPFSPMSTSRAKPSPDRSSGKKKLPPEILNPDESALNNPDLGPFLLTLARDTIASGEGPARALDYALRASKSFETCAVDGEPSLLLVMSLHVLGAIYCSLGMRGLGLNLGRWVVGARAGVK